MKEKLLSILAQLRPDVEFDQDSMLIDEGVLDSFDIVSLVGQINEIFDVDISVEHIVPENFNSVEAMLTLIKCLQEEG
jgi:acyl carrier protein